VHGQAKEATLKTLIARFALSATLALAAAGTAHGAAYTLVNLGAPLGGTASNPASINDLGWVAGSSNLPGNAAAHAVLWLHGLPFDLGTLGGPSSAVLWPVKNDRGLIAGVSQTANRDPLGETGWSCNAFLPASPNTCVGFVWQDGRMSPLPTLGGNNGFATGANDRGQVVGWAETTLHDPTCAAPQVLQFRAVVYGPRPGQIAPLPAFRGDPDAAATAINDQGQIVGVSGICGNSVGALSAKHAVLWQNGTVTDLGNLGGAGWNTPMAINEAGQIVGFADLPGDDNAQNPNFQAFLWTPERGMQNLQTLPGDALSEGLGINSQGVVVGESIAAGFASTRAFLWQNGRMTDLNTLIPAGSNLYLIDANDINDGGEIAGQAIDQTTGDIVSYVAIPVHQASSGAAAPGDEAAAGAEVPPVALPDHVRQMLLQRLGLGAWPAGAR
jgi:probable HAF family extracellular repeat protein